MIMLLKWLCNFHTLNMNLIYEKQIVFNINGVGQVARQVWWGRSCFARGGSPLRSVGGPGCELHHPLWPAKTVIDDSKVACPQALDRLISLDFLSFQLTRTKFYRWWKFQKNSKAFEKYLQLELNHSFSLIHFITIQIRTTPM